MAQDDDKMIRNALDAVDRGRRLAMVGVVALFVATVITLYMLFHVVGGPPPPGGSDLTLKAVFATAVSIMLLIACCTAVVMIHITRMTKSVLRAIDAKR
jgi:hypothetical protein